jgi:hypothetical protein
MKISVLHILFLFILSGYCRNSYATTLKIYSGDCRLNPPHVLIGSDTIRIYRGETLVKMITSSIFRSVREPLVVENLSPGPYEIIFVNTFEQKVNKTITIPDTTEFSYRICPDELIKYPLNSLALLKENESIILYFKSTNCMVDSKEQLKIVRKKAHIEATLRIGNISTTIVLTKEKEDDFARFENELHCLKGDAMCTTQDYYTLRSKSGTFAKRDGTCNWEGYYFLKNSLFGGDGQ